MNLNLFPNPYLHNRVLGNGGIPAGLVTMCKSIDLSAYDNRWYKPGRKPTRAIWFLVNALVMRSSWIPSSTLRVLLLKMFGARIGKGVVLKSNVNIKYPWKLRVGDNAWIGEGVWIDNLGDVEIGANVCLSQGAMLLCGNHNYKIESFDLIVGNITLEDGVWIGAQSVVCPGVSCKSHAVLTVCSVATSNLEAFGVYRGNPATRVRTRIIE